MFIKSNHLKRTIFPAGTKHASCGRRPVLSAKLHAHLVRMLEGMERLVIEEKNNSQTDILEKQLQSASGVMVGCCWTSFFKKQMWAPLYPH